MRVQHGVLQAVYADSPLFLVQYLGYRQVGGRETPFRKGHLACLLIIGGDIAAGLWYAVLCPLVQHKRTVCSVCTFDQSHQHRAGQLVQVARSRDPPGNACEALPVRDVTNDKSRRYRLAQPIQYRDLGGLPDKAIAAVPSIAQFYLRAPRALLLCAQLGECILRFLKKRGERLANR